MSPFGEILKRSCSLYTSASSQLSWLVARVEDSHVASSIPVGSLLISSFCLRSPSFPVSGPTQSRGPLCVCSLLDAKSIQQELLFFSLSTTIALLSLKKSVRIGPVHMLLLPRERKHENSLTKKNGATQESLSTMMCIASGHQVSARLLLWYVGATILEGKRSVFSLYFLGFFPVFFLSSAFPIFSIFIGFLLFFSVVFLWFSSYLSLFSL